MKLEDQVCSLELAKKLKELGVGQESLFYWGRDSIDIGEYRHILVMRFNGTLWHFDDEVAKIQGKHGNNIWFGEIESCNDYSAYTVAELGELLPMDVLFNSWRMKNGDIRIGNPTCKGMRFTANTEVNARAKMLIYLLENKLIGINK